MNLTGLHHLTAMASDPARSVAFYTTTLGMRMVKQTVNFDDPETYHLYYGDERGTPGTILTFFFFPGIRPGRPGPGQVTAFSLRTPPDSLGFWKNHLSEQGVMTEILPVRFGTKALGFHDPDGFRIELVESPGQPGVKLSGRAGIAPQHAISGFHGATLALRKTQPSRRLLTEVMGAKFISTEHNRSRFRLGNEERGVLIDLLLDDSGPPGIGGSGTIHHIAWSTPDDSTEEEARLLLLEDGQQPTPVVERHYFRSVYFREPSGILYEIATDPPGFTVDESEEMLGQKLVLPPWLEKHRSQIVSRLPPLL